jgi:hypothetical protein
VPCRHSSLSTILIIEGTERHGHKQSVNCASSRPPLLSLYPRSDRGNRFRRIRAHFFLNDFFAKLHLPSLYILHGIVFSSWLVLLVTQSAPVSAKQIRIHQKLGYASIAIVVSMISLGWIMAVQAAQRGFYSAGRSPATRFSGVSDSRSRSLYGSGKRRLSAAQLPGNTQAAHDRCHGHDTHASLGAHLLAFQHSSDHLQGPGGAVLLVCMAYDFFARKRVHPAYIWGSLAFVAFCPYRRYFCGRHRSVARSGALDHRRVTVPIVFLGWGTSGVSMTSLFRAEREWLQVSCQHISCRRERQ